MARHVVAPVGEIPAGGCKLVAIGNRAIVVFNVNGEYFALYHRINARSAYGCPSRSINSLAMSPLSRSCVTHAINRIK